MKNVLSFNIPFSGFNNLTFSNCFASVYMFLENIAGVSENECAAKNDKNCNGCGHCKNSAYYFLFDTICGRSSMRPTFDATPPDCDGTPESIHFILGFAGWGYAISTTDFPRKIQDSIDAGRPVIARMKDGANGAFRVLIGYDNGSLIMAAPKNAQQSPSQAPTYDDIADIIVFTGKKEREYRLLDALRRIEQVIESNIGHWDGTIQKFKYWPENLKDADFEELKRRFKRACEMAWYNFNCHNFAEVFRHRIIDELKDSRLDGYNNLCRPGGGGAVDRVYDDSHTRNWQIIALYECRDWSSRRYHELEWGMCESVVQCLERLKDNDTEVLAAVREAIRILQA